MPRNLVLCLDGTGGEAGRKNDSNSVLVYQRLLNDPERQVAFYDPGVGTFSSPGAWTPFARWLSQLGGRIWGGGLRQNLGDAYLWLMRTWQPGDRIYVFGFSRGAFTARALVGMLGVIGLMRPGSENQLQYAISMYARRGGEQNLPWDEIHRFSALFAQQVDGRSTVPVAYVGIWDSVKAMGLTRLAPKWPYTRSLPNAQRIRHAVAIDERRRPVAEYLVQPKHPENLEEVWFTGVHSDVGGTYKNEAQLSTIALKWILEGAIAAGLLVRQQAVRHLFSTVTEDFALGAAHRNNPVWALLIPRPRRIPPAARVHASVRRRIQQPSDYRPKIPSDVVWVDEDWATPPAT